MTLEAIKEPIAGLPPTDKATLVTWLSAQNDEEWNRQMEADFSEGGAGMPLLAQSDAEITGNYIGAATTLIKFIEMMIPVCKALEKQALGSSIP